MHRNATLPATSAAKAPWAWTDGRVEKPRRTAAEDLADRFMPAACWAHTFMGGSSLDLTVFVLGLAARAAADERIPMD